MMIDIARYTYLPCQIKKKINLNKKYQFSLWIFLVMSYRYRNNYDYLFLFFNFYVDPTRRSRLRITHPCEKAAPNRRKGHAFLSQLRDVLVRSTIRMMYMSYVGACCVRAYVRMCTCMCVEFTRACVYMVFGFYKKYI